MPLLSPAHRGIASPRNSFGTAANDQLTTRKISSRGSEFNTDLASSVTSQTHLVKRNDTRQVFEKFPTVLYPKTLKDHDNAKEVMKELMAKHSMIINNPHIDYQEENKMLNQVLNFDHKNT